MRCERCDTPWNGRDEGWNGLRNGDVITAVVCPGCATAAENSQAVTDHREVSGVFGRPIARKEPGAGTPGNDH